MAVRIAVGNDCFEDVINSGLYYADKTELLYDLAERHNNKVTLFTRPRRVRQNAQPEYDGKLF